VSDPATGKPIGKTQDNLQGQAERSHAGRFTRAADEIK